MGKKVLVIEDSAAMRSMIASTLEEIKGVDVVEANNGFEALKILPSQTFDLILTDINMPEINGLEIVSFVKGNEQYKAVPVIIVSTEQSDEDIKKGLALGATAYVTKPFDPEKLKETVLRALGK